MTNLNTLEPNAFTFFEADELTALARVDVERGALDAALHKLKLALAAPTPSQDTIIMTARLYAQLGLVERAKPLFQRYLSAQPDALNEMFQFGMVHFDGGQITEALSIWDQVLASHPTHPPALFYRALASYQLGQIAEARHALDILYKSTAHDNLYFGRAKELSQILDQAATGARLGAPSPEGLRMTAKDAYKSEH